MSLPLKGVKVLDLSRILAGPYATMMLGDMGAEVIKIEKPKTGDDTRSWGPPNFGTESAYFLSINRNKKSVVIDLKSSEGVQLVKRLMKKSDVVIENFAPGVAKKLGLDRDILTKDNSLVWCSITGYGQDGPLAKRLGYATMIEAHSGLMHSTGLPETPVKVGVAVTDIITGLHACSGILAALLNRSKTGNMIDCSLLASQVSAMANIGSNWLVAGQEAKRLGTDHASIVPYGTVKTRDGRIAIAAGNDGQFVSLMKSIGREDLLCDKRYLKNSDRVENRLSLMIELEKVFVTETSSEWIRLFDSDQRKYSFAFSKINTMEDVFSDPQVQHLNMVVDCNHSLGKVQLAGIPIKFSNSGLGKLEPPPLLGEHTMDVLKSELKLTDIELENLKKNGVI